MTKQVQFELQIGANFSEALTLSSSQTGRTHRADIRVTVSSTTVKLAFRTTPDDGQGTITLSGDTITLSAGADITELLSLDTDSALWAIDIESVGATAADVRREASGTVFVTRDVTRLTEPTAAANASKLLTFSINDGQTLTSEEQTALQEKIGITAGEPFSFIVTSGEPSGAGVASPGWYCFDNVNGNLYGPLPDYTPPEVPEWPLIGNFGAGTADVDAVIAITDDLQDQIDALPSGGGMSIGGAITGGTAKRLLYTNASTQLASTGAFQVDTLDFSPGMTSRETIRGLTGSSGFLADVDGGFYHGRADSGVGTFIGFFGTHVVNVAFGGRFGWANQTTDHRGNDTWLQRRSAQVIEGATLAGRTYTVATAPDAATFIDCAVVFTDSSRGRRPCYSDGTNWRFYSDDAILS